MAVTRRLTSVASGRPSFEKIELMCFSTAPFVRKSDVAIEALLLPSATSASTSRSRAVSCANGDSAERERFSTSASTIFGSITHPPAATSSIAETSWSRLPRRSFRM